MNQNSNSIQPGQPGQPGQPNQPSQPGQPAPGEQQYQPTSEQQAPNYQPGYQPNYQPGYQPEQPGQPGQQAPAQPAPAPNYQQPSQQSYTQPMQATQTQQPPQQSYAQPTQAAPYSFEQQAQEGNVLMGFLGAFLGAIVGAIPYAIVYRMGFVSGWLGVLIAVAANFGYTKLKGKKSAIAYVALLSASIFGVFFAEALGDCLYIATMVSNGEIFNASFIDIPGLYLRWVFSDPVEYLADSAKNLLLGGIFATVAALNFAKTLALSKKNQ